MQALLQPQKKVQSLRKNTADVSAHDQMLTQSIHV